MEENNPGSIAFQFISEPSDINYGGKVHGGEVMKWIDQTAYACARNWAESYCVTVYVSGIQFHKPINIGEIVKIRARVIHTGNTSIHVAVDVYGRDLEKNAFEKKTDCVIVFVSLDENSKPKAVKKWVPQSESEIKMEQYAIELKNLHGKLQKQSAEYWNELFGE